MRMVMQQNEETSALTPRKSRCLNNCCCVCSLQTGCIIIGTLTLINAICSFHLPISALMDQSEQSYDLKGKGLFMFVMRIIYAILELATSLSLIYGADKKRTSFMDFWLYVHCIELVLISCLTLYYLFFFWMVGIFFFELFRVTAAMIGLPVGIGVAIYTISIVYNFSGEVTEEIQTMNEELNISRL